MEATARGETLVDVTKGETHWTHVKGPLREVIKRSLRYSWRRQNSRYRDGRESG